MISGEVCEDEASKAITNNIAAPNNKAIPNNKNIVLPSEHSLTKSIHVSKIEFEAGKFDALMSAMAEKLELFGKK